MRTIPAAFSTRLASEPGARTRLCKIERLDGTIKYWSVRSDGIADTDGNVYTGNIIEGLSNIRYRSDGSVSSASLGVPVGDAYVTESELRRKLYQGAKVTIVSRHTDGTAGQVTLFVGWIGSQRDDGFRVTFEVRSRMSKGLGTTSAAMSPGCRAKLGSNQWPFRCCLDLTPFTDNGTVATVASDYVITATLDASPARADEFYKFGTLTWLTGVNVGTKTMVREHAGSTLTLSDTVFAPEVGDTFSVTAGCDKTITTCAQRFNNALNFQGEDRLPAIEQDVF